MIDINKKSVLVIEDNQQVNRLFCKQLSITGRPVHSASSVWEALKLLAQGLRPDLIILDLELGDGYGTEVLDYLSENGYLPNVIVVSAHSYSTHNQLAQYHVDEVLVKPVSPRVLSALAHNLLNQ